MLLRKHPSTTFYTRFEMSPLWQGRHFLQMVSCLYALLESSPRTARHAHMQHSIMHAPARSLCLFLASHIRGSGRLNQGVPCYVYRYVLILINFANVAASDHNYVITRKFAGTQSATNQERICNSLNLPFRYNYHT